jgi:hypothetical protein
MSDEWEAHALRRRLADAMEEIESLRAERDRYIALHGEAESRMYREMARSYTAGASVTAWHDISAELRKACCL